MRKSTLTTVLLAVVVGIVAALAATAGPAGADDEIEFELVAEIEPMTPVDPPAIDDFAVPSPLQFDLRVDCGGGTPPVTLWLKNSGVADVTLEVTNLMGDGGFVLEAGSEDVREVWYHPIEMDETGVTVSIKDGDQVFADQESVVCLRPDVSYAFVVDCEAPGAAVELTNHGVLAELAGITVDEGAPNAVPLQPGETVSIDLPHLPDEVVEVEVFAAGEYPFAGPWSYTCPPAEVVEPDAEADDEADPQAEPTPETEPTTETVAPVDVIEAPDRPDVDNDVDELAAPVIVPISGQGSSSGVGVALVLGLGLVALVVGSGVALLRSRI